MDKKAEKKDYEISFVVKDQGGENSVSDILSQLEASVIYKSPVSEVYLSYPIKKNKHGYFGYFHFSAFPEAADKLGAALNLSQSVLRFLIVTPPVGVVEKFHGQRPENRVSSRSKSAEVVSAPPKSGMLTNEALEEKLEEILK